MRLVYQVFLISDVIYAQWYASPGINYLVVYAGLLNNKHVLECCSTKFLLKSI